MLCSGQMGNVSIQLFWISIIYVSGVHLIYPRCRTFVLFVMHVFGQTWIRAAQRRKAAQLFHCSPVVLELPFLILFFFFFNQHPAKLLAHIYSRRHFLQKVWNKWIALHRRMRLTPNVQTLVISVLVSITSFSEDPTFACYQPTGMSHSICHRRS